MRMRLHDLFATTGLAALALTGCGGGEGGGAGGGGGAAARAAFPVDTTTAATITGTIRFQGTPPRMATIDMSEEPACRDKYAEPPRAQTVVVGANGALKNVFVYVKAGLDTTLRFPVPADSAWIDQAGCRYEPHVFGAQVGQTIAIKNSDPVLHNINAKPTANRGFNISQPQAGMVSTRTFLVPETMVPIGCDVHGWMSAYVGVLSHPYFGTSADDGTFTIRRLPPGTYTLEAWHERFGTQTMQVTVGANETKTVEFTFRPTTS